VDRIARARAYETVAQFRDVCQSTSKYKHEYCRHTSIVNIVHDTVANIRFPFQSLVTFVNKHLNKVNLEVSDLDTQFHDGVYLTLLMGLLEGFFVPLYSFHLTPQDFDQKVHNVSFAFDLMQDVGLAKPKARPEGKL